jgi:hypothetical protein
MVMALVGAMGLGGALRAQAANGCGAVDPGAVAVDAIIVRPFCLVATVLGSAAFVVSLPWAVPSKSVHRAAKSLVVCPARTTFKRPLGDLDDIATY